MNNFEEILRIELETKGFPKNEADLGVFVKEFFLRFLKTQKFQEKGLQEVINLIELIESEDTGAQGSVIDSNGDKVEVESKKTLGKDELLKIIKGE